MHRMCLWNGQNGRKVTMQRSENRRTPSRPDFVSLRRSALPHDFLADSKYRRDGLSESATYASPVSGDIKVTSCHWASRIEDPR